MASRAWFPVWIAPAGPPSTRGLALVGLLGLAAGLGCGAPVKAPAPLPAGDEITLYRDRAVIRQRVEVDVPEATRVTLRVPLPAGVEAGDVVILDRGALTIGEIASERTGARPTPSAGALDDEAIEGDEDGGEDEELAEPAAPPTASVGPTEITLVVGAPRAGRFAIGLGYVTDRLAWDAAYTMTTTAARSRATLRGAIAIRNTTQRVFTKARTYVVDAELGVWRGRIAEQLGSTLANASATPIVRPRLLGTLTLGVGETRVELLPGEAPRAMRSVLVYDPIGTRLDHGGVAPIRDPSLGLDKRSARVTESFEIARPEASAAGLPAGPVRLVERRADGTLTVLGQARLFDTATKVAEHDIIDIGTAEGVRGTRERREISIDDPRKRLVEEFVLTIENTRLAPVEVVLREHLYRGQNWALAYSTASDARKDGPQQISLRTIVPPKGEARLLYVVVYTWP